MTTVAPALSAAEALTSLSTSKKSIPRLRRPYSAERDPATPNRSMAAAATRMKTRTAAAKMK